MTQRLGRLELQAIASGGYTWVGRDPLTPNLWLLVRTAHRDDVGLYAQAQLVSELAATAAFRLHDIVLDDAADLVGYALVAPGPIVTLHDSLSTIGPTKTAVALCRGISLLHEHNIVLRAFASHSFVVSGEWGVPTDFSRATRFSLINGVASVPGLAESGGANDQRSYDPPEAAAEGYDGVRGDVFGMGVLLKSMGLATQRGDLLDSMMSHHPAGRPASFREVLERLGGTE